MFNFPFHKATLVKQIVNNRTKLYRMAFAWSHDAMLADDLAQEALMLALQKIDHLKDTDALNSWMYTILNNVWLGHLRKQKPNEDIDNLVITDHNSPEHELLAQQIDLIIKDAISRLPNGQRQAVSLVDLDGLSYNEVANILQIPIGTVMSRLSRARRALALTLNRRQRYHNESLSTDLLHSTSQPKLCVVK